MREVGLRPEIAPVDILVNLLVDLPVDFLMDLSLLVLDVQGQGQDVHHRISAVQNLFSLLSSAQQLTQLGWLRGWLTWL